MQGGRILLVWILICALSAVPCGAAPSSCRNIRAELEMCIFRAHVGGHWSRYLPDDAEFYADSLEAIPWQRVSRGLPVKDREFTAGEPSALGPACTGDCRDCVYRRFFVDGDTLSFSLARVPEECSETPKLSWRAPSGDRHTETLVPLFNWNVDALWCTPHFLIFGLHADNEGAISGDALALWNLDTGVWCYAPSGTQYGSYFTGMSLPGLFPTWPRIEIAEDHGAIVLRGGHTFAALWPAQRAWAIVDPTNGTAAPTVRNLYTRSLPKSLRDGVLASMRRMDPKATQPQIVQIMTPACPGDPSMDAVLVSAATAEHSEYGGNDLFGVFVADAHLTKVVQTLEIFPSLRTGDYTALFIPDAAADSIVVIGLGATYGDQMVVHRFGCATRQVRDGNH